MKKHLNRTLALFFLLLFVKGTTFAQVPPLTVPGYTACPCQSITASATWNNVSSITYTLLSPGTPVTTSVFPTSNFQIFNCTQTSSNVTFTLIAAGSYTGSPVSQTVQFNLNIAPPAAMTLTNVVNYCYGSTGNIIAPSGGIFYSVSPAAQSVISNNIISFPNLTNGNIGGYTVTAVIGGCTLTGVTNINVSQLKQITVNTTSNICSGNNAVLTANMPGGQNYQWFFNTVGPLNNPATSTNHTVQAATVSDAGTYVVTADDVFNGVTCPYTATTAVTVVATSPVVPTANPSNVICQGQAIGLSANANGATSFSWSGPQFSSLLQSPTIPNAVPSNAGNYTATAFFVGSAITCTTSASFSIGVVAMGQPVISGTTSLCQGQTASLTAVANPVPLSYTWFGPAFPTPTIAPSGGFGINNAQPSASGNYIVKATFVQGTTQCVSTSSAQLSVVPVNTVSVIPPGQVCSPANAFLQALATGANSYQWVGPNGFSSPGANVFVYYPTPSASGVYSVTAYFGGGGNLVCTSTNTVQLTVNPVLTFSLVPRQQVCYNSPVTISGPAGATSYTWTSSTGYTSFTKDVVLPSAQPNNSGTYTLNISLGPCNSAATSEIAVLTPIQFTLTPFDRTVCRGDTIVLEGGASGGSENYAYTWNPGVYLESTTGAKQMSVPLGSVLYNLIVHDIACPNYTIAHSFNVNVLQPPMPTIQLPRNQGCSPFTQNYDAGTKGQAAITTYDFGGKRVFQQRDTTYPVPYTLNEAGIYTLTIYSKGKNGCSGTFQYPYPLIVDPRPGSDVFWSPETPTTIDDITFYPTSKEPVTNYRWTFLGGVTLGDTNSVGSTNVTDTSIVKNPQRLYEKYGTYPVMLVSKNEKECIDTVVKFVKVIDALQIYVPNSFTPNDDGINDVFQPKGSGMKLENFSMDIFNRAGLVVFSTKDINEGWDGKVKGQVVKDADYIYKIRVVGMNGEGRREYTGYITLIK